MDDAPAFMPVVTEARHEAASAPTANGCGAITIEIGGAIVRAEPGVDPIWLRDVLRAVKSMRALARWSRATPRPPLVPSTGQVSVLSSNSCNLLVMPVYITPAPPAPPAPI
jgi:hypothetical protein